MSESTTLLRRLSVGLFSSTAIGYAAMRRGSLTASGWLGAIITGTLTYGCGGWPWGLSLITFFVSSSALSRYKEQIKEQRAGEKFAKGGRRDFAQTLANGGVGALLAVAYAFSRRRPALLSLFVGVMATVTADTWATELGVLSPHQPRLITTGRHVPAGTSGGITPLGTLASLLGGLLIGGAMRLFLSLERRPDVPPRIVAAGTLGGLCGSLTDSLLGATVQALYQRPDGSQTERPIGRDGTPNRYLRGWTWMNNDLVNLLSSLVGGLVALAISRR